MLLKSHRNLPIQFKPYSGDIRYYMAVQWHTIETYALLKWLAILRLLQFLTPVIKCL